MKIKLWPSLRTNPRYASLNSSFKTMPFIEVKLACCFSDTKQFLSQDLNRSVIKLQQSFDLSKTSLAVLVQFNICHYASFYLSLKCYFYIWTADFRELFLVLFLEISCFSPPL